MARERTIRHPRAITATSEPNAGTQTAAVQRLDLPPMDTGWTGWKTLGQPLAWQMEGYRHYDRCGELHFSGNAIASMASRCAIGIYKKTPEGEPGEPVTTGRVGKLAAQLAGGGEERPEVLRLSTLNDFLVGDYYTCVETPKGGGPDRWYTLSVSEVRRHNDLTLTFERPAKYGGGTVTYRLPNPRKPGDKPKNSVMLWRTFQEHAQLTDHPDSSVRAAIPILNLIEQYDKRSSAQNDSRLAGAGVLFLPDKFDFPIPPPDPNGAPTPSTPVEAFEVRLGDLMGRTLKDPANARSLVPIMATVAAEQIKEIRWLTFETPLDEQTMARLDQCIRRLGLALDMPPELLMGVGSMNHWSAWASEQSTHKVFVAPRLARWCHAVTIAWLKLMLTAMGEDPDAFMVWFDMAALTVRPDRQADALALWDRGLIQDEFVLDAGNWPKAAAHTDETYQRWIITQSIIKNPQLLADPTFAATIGIQAQAPIQAEATIGDTRQPAAIEASETPAEPTVTRTPAQEALVAGAEMAAMHSLAVAGKKLLTRGVRDELMSQFAGRAFDLHTRLAVEGADHATRLLDGTFDLLPALASRTGTDQRILREALLAYCSGQMVAAQPHSPDQLTLFLSEAILAAGHQFCGPAGCRNQHNPGVCDRRREAVTV